MQTRKNDNSELYYQAREIPRHEDKKRTRTVAVANSLLTSSVLECTGLQQNLRMEWHPATVDEVKKIVRYDLAECDEEQILAYQKYVVEPYVAPILRYGHMENAVVVARRGDEVIYWEDVEEGFNLSPVSPDGRTLEHWCNQDELRFALNAWIDGRTRTVRPGPPMPIG
jgi:hypothetical protein